MTVGPYGGAFGGTVWDPATAPVTPAGTPLVIPQVRTIDAVAAAGVALAVLAPASSGNGRLVRRVTVKGPAGSAYLFVGDPTNPRNVVDGTAAGDFDVAEYSPELYVPVGMALSVTWAAAGDAFMRVEWTDLP